MPMEPTIQSMPARTVVGLGSRFISILSPKANNFEVIPRLWHDYGQRQSEIADRKGQEALGCVWCLEGEHELYYLAGAEVTSTAHVPTGMEVREIPAGKYAVFIHRGSLKTLGKTMSFIHGTWFAASGHQWRNGPEIEVYGPKFDLNSETSELEICVPIK